MILATAFAIAALMQGATAGDAKMSDSLYSFKTTSLQGQARDLSEFKGKVTLVVNVASMCGYTPQYKGLQALHTELAGRGFQVVGFPSNEFGGQEPGTAEEIQTFCERNYGVTFPMFSKVVTKPGAGQSPIYGFLTKNHPAPDWNFCKYLISKDGKVLAFFKSAVKPESAELRDAIEKALR